MIKLDVKNYNPRLNVKPRKSDVVIYNVVDALKSLDDEFWCGVPTATKLPPTRKYFLDPDSVKTVKGNFSTYSWLKLCAVAHVLHPMWCKDAEKMSTNIYGGLNKPFIVYDILDTGVTCKQSYCGNVYYIVQLNTISGNTGTIKYNNVIELKYSRILQEALAKWDKLWNKLRKAGQRRAGLIDDTETEVKKKLSKRQKETEQKRAALLSVARTALISVSNYVTQLEHGNVNKDDIAQVYQDMINLASANKEYKNVAGTLLAAKKPK